MKAFGIITNTERDKGYEYTRYIAEHLLAQKAKVLLPVETATAVHQPDCAASGDSLYQSDCLIVLGGDGTMLAAAREAAAKQVPLMGINLGTLGYLTDTEAEGGVDSINRLLKGQYHLEKRMMLEVGPAGNQQPSSVALNDISIKCDTFKMFRFKLYINQQYVDTYHADGIIISTPTGSTAYNLSAGGPVLAPRGEMIAVTPICPHMLASRPMVVSSGDEISVEPVARDATIHLDGQDYGALGEGIRLTVKKSKYYTAIVKTNHLNFYDILRKKL